MKSRILFFFIVLSVSMSAHYGETLKTDKDLSKISKALVYDIEKCQALISAKRKTQLTRDNRIWLKLVSAVIAQKKEDAYSATIIVEELKLQKIEDPFLNAYLLYVDALLNVPIKNFALALENTLEAKETFERLSEFAYVADCLSLEARIYTKLDRLEDAIESLSKSIAIHRSSNDSLHLAGDYHNLALVLDRTNNDSILNLIITATQMNKQIGNAFWEANNHYILSIHQMGRGNDSLAYTEIDIAKSLYESLHMYNMVLQTQLHTANMLYADSLPDSAQVLYLDVISKEKELRTGLNLETAYSNLAELAYTQRNLVDYRRFSQRAKHISDSLLNLVNQNTISVIEIRNKYKFKQTELTIANQDFMLESRTKSIWIAVISSLLIITFFLIYVVVKSRKLEKAKSALKELRLEQDLELKQKELTLQIMGQIKQNTSLENLKELIQKIDSEAPKRLKQNLNKVKRILRTDSKAELWKEFETRFTSIHSEFYERLKNISPDLSPAEIKVCAFLRLGLNTKEISSLLYKTPASIEVDRSRIRKKLGLTSQEVNLTTFIQEI